MRVLLNIVVQIVMARFLGPAVFGEITTVTKFVGVFFAIPVFGLDELIVAEMVKEKNEERSRDILFGAIIMRLLLSSIAFVLLLVGGYLTFGFGTSKFLQTAVLGLIYFAYPLITFELLFQKNYEIHIAAKSRMIGTSLISVGRLIGSINQYATFFFIILNTLEYFFLAVSFLGAYLKKQGSLYLRKIDFALMARLMKYAAPTALSAFILLAEQRYSLVMVERHFTASQLGIFSLGITLLDIIQYLPLTIGIASFPALVEIHGQSQDKFYAKIQQVINSVVLLIVGIWLSHMVCGKFLIRLFLGDRYEGLSQMLSWIVLASLIYSINHIRLRWLTILQMQRVWLFYSLLSGVGSIVLQTFLIPKFGIAGVFLSWFLAQFVANVLTSILSDEFKKTSQSVLIAPWLIVKGIKNLKF